MQEEEGKMMHEIMDVRRIYRQLFDQTITEFAKIPSDKFYGPTVLPSWKVNNIISHLTGNALYKTTDIRRMAEQQEKSSIDFDSLAHIINANNERWVEALDYLDQTVLLDLYESSYSAMLLEFEKIQDLKSHAVHDVLWYSDDPSPWWLDMAREYTELWMHTAQICGYLDIAFPFEKQYSTLFHRICLLAVRRLFKSEENEVILRIQIGTETYNISSENGFGIPEKGKPADAVITMTDNAAWKLFSGISPTPEEASSIQIEGDRRIGGKFLKIESVMVKAE